MFKVKPPETFPATMLLKGQGREQTLKAVCKHMPRSGYIALLDQVAKGEVSPEDAVMRLFESWEADAELSAATIKQLADDQPGIDWALINGYGAALAVALRGN